MTVPVPLLIFGLASPAALAEDAEGAPGAWRGEQLTTLPPPPAPAPPPTAVVIPAPAAPPAPNPVGAPPPAAGAAAAPWTGTATPASAPAPEPAPPLSPAAAQLSAQLDVEIEAGLVEVPRIGAPGPGRGLDRVPIAPEPSMPSPRARGGADGPAPPRLHSRDYTTTDAQGHTIDPRNLVDFTAYSLDFGEVEVGLTRVAVGLMPRVLVSTSPVLDGLGAWNVGAKADLIRVGPLDLAPLFHGYWLSDPGGFRAQWLKGGLQGSLIATPRWSVHFGGSFDWLGADGIPQYETIQPLLVTESSRAAAQQWLATIEANNGDLELRQFLFSLRFATDVRLTWRDSLILQASAIPWGAAAQRATAEVQGQTIDLPPVLQLDELLVNTGRKRPEQAIADSYVVSLAWQASWEHLQLRMGFGSSATALAWVLPTIQLGWRFGGFDNREAAARSTASGASPSATPATP